MDLPSKREITRVFLKTAGRHDDDASVEKHLWIWWRNPISSTSMRLTHEGFEFLSKDLDLEHYTFALTDEAGYMTSGLLLALDQKFTTPFYLAARKRIVFFGEHDGIMLALYGNNLTQFLENAG